MSQIQYLLEPHFKLITEQAHGDSEFCAAAAATHCTFSITSGEDLQRSVLVTITDGQASLSIGPAYEAEFGLQARSDDWVSFFAEKLVRPYQSYWGMLRVLGSENGVNVLGDATAFARCARIWRILLDRARDAVHGRTLGATWANVPADEEMEADSVVGRYTWVDMSTLGKVKTFYEKSGTGSQDILFLHTAGSDGRQYHSLMNNTELCERCTMFTFDFPGHGRSSLGSGQFPETYALDEEAYLEAIGKVIKRLGLTNTIICGASMGGQACLAAATKARELGIRGAIPCEACEHHPLPQAIYAMGGIDASLLDPERVCGMCAPMSPEYYKRQIWWHYSSQGYKVFPGDLKFYFQGFDGRGRMEMIDTRFCPVYMLTGEYDYSCTSEASQATAEKIPGARFETMQGLGHFPLTENPRAVLPYLLRAIEFIRKVSKLEPEE